MHSGSAHGRTDDRPRGWAMRLVDEHRHCARTSALVNTARPCGDAHIPALPVLHNPSSPASSLLTFSHSFFALLPNYDPLSLFVAGSSRECVSPADCLDAPTLCCIAGSVRWHLRLPGYLRQPRQQQCGSFDCCHVGFVEVHPDRAYLPHCQLLRFPVWRLRRALCCTLDSHPAYLLFHMLI